ncbi:MAG: MBL fold metallo-hydrolase, partial [Cystobacterineae bacterium]|nr:MBL fold metallo-hydrolase [Cystobacterineae bacterium]
VLLTHAHVDHMGGIFMELTEGMKPRFPNATVWVHETELAFWTSPGLMEMCPEAQKNECAQIQQGVQLLRALLGDTLKTFSSGQELLPGIQALHTPGHTAGHTAFLLSSEGQKMLFVGDMVLNVQLQTAFPRVSIAFDADAPMGIETRLEWMEKAAHEKLWIAGSHFPFPGIGQLEKQSTEKYAFIPIQREGERSAGQ